MQDAEVCSIASAMIKTKYVICLMFVKVLMFIGPIVLVMQEVLLYMWSDSAIEYILLELPSKSNGRPLLGCIYRPNRTIDYGWLLNVVSDILLEYTDIILAGDFNSNLLSESHLVDNFISLGLYSVNETIPKTEYFCCDWSCIYHLRHVDCQLEVLTNNIQYFFNKFVPLRTKVIKPMQNPWSSNEMKTIINSARQRDVAYLRWSDTKLG